MERKPELVRAYAERRMMKRELITWKFDEIERTVTFFIPDDVDVSTYPDSLFGYRVLLHPLPRPTENCRA
ncbi:hypothetical protein AB0K98_29700 [Streptomyces werraensis]|uniref:hypothetical protein n=1 Tax=Streptomyces werraensis TaxID=68284 RepID=UPI0034242440